MMQQIILAAMLAVLLSLSGCAQMFTAKTKASYKVTTKDGVITEVMYESDKDQVGLDAQIGEVKVKVDKASTPTEVIAGSLAVQLQMLRLMESLMQKAPVK